MKKIFTLIAALATIVALNAATVTWIPANGGFEKNQTFPDETINLNDNISLNLQTGEAVSNNEPAPPKYRDVTNMASPAMLCYSKNILTLTATDADITSVKFNILTTPGADQTTSNDYTPDWAVMIDGTKYNAANDTWTGNSTNVVITINSRTSIVSLEIGYNAVNSNPGQYKPATLRFTAENTTNPQNVTVTDNDVTAVFTSTGSAKFTDNNAYFGTADSYITIKGYLGPGGKSSKGVDSETKGTFTFPCAGTLTIYAYNNNDEDRQLQLVQNNATIFDQMFTKDDYVTQEGKTSKIYPIYTVDVERGTAYLLWPINQVTLVGFDFEPAGGNDNPGGGDDEGDDNPGEYESAALFFTADLIGQGEMAQNVTLTDNGTSVTFTSNSANAQIDDITFNYGTAEEYTAIQYRYRPGGKSSNGVNSTNKGVFTFPCDGTLYLYVFNNQDGDPRNIQIVQNGETIFDHPYKSDEFVNVGDDENVVKVWPVYTAEVAKGTATLLWPVNQVMISGFEFVPAESDGDDTTSVITVEEMRDARAYDLMGRPVGDDYRGIYIKGGKKYIRR